MDEEHEQRVQSICRLYEQVDDVLLHDDGQRHQEEDQPELPSHEPARAAERVTHLPVLPDDDGPDETEEREEGEAGGDQEDDERGGTEHEEKVGGDETAVWQRPQHVTELRRSLALLLGTDDVIEKAGEEGRTEQRHAGGQEHEHRQQTAAVAARVGEGVGEHVNAGADAEHDDGRSRHQKEPAAQHAKRRRDDGARRDLRNLVRPCRRHRRSVAITPCADRT
ncbi:MAG: hypothetical protein M3046_14670 [Actinomycetota bacterium]|nr:hypothetical protein [Actinomycetota bacterium]